MCSKDKVLNSCSPGLFLFEMGKRKDTTGRIARSLKALADTEKYQQTSPETYRELRTLIFGNLKAAASDENTI